MRTLVGAAALAAACGGFDSVASAASIPVTNFSFETPDDLEDSSKSTAAMEGWTFFTSLPTPFPSYTNAAAGAFDPTDAYSTQPQLGEQMAYVMADNRTGNSATAGLRSAALTTLQEYTQYTLTVAVALDRYVQIDSNVAAIVRFVDGDNSVIGTPTSRTLSQLSNLSWTNLTLTHNTQTNPELIGEQLFVELVNQSSQTNGDARTIVFDNVRLTAMAIPEPTVVAALAASSMGLLIRRRQKAS